MSITPRSEEDIQRLIAERKERLKELTCINETTQIIKENRSIAETLTQIAQILPRAWQYPEMTVARLWFEGEEYTSQGFREGQWKQSQKFETIDNRKGEVEVFYLKKFPQLDEGPFLKEERQLIDGVAFALSEAVDRKRAEEQVQNLAKFPSENPNPVLRIARDGTLLYANDASESILEEWGCREGQSVPDEWCGIISGVFETRQERRIEKEHAGRISPACFLQSFC